MTSDPKLPIPSYRVSMLGPNPGWDLAVYDGISEELCKAADVRELVERMEKAEAQLTSLREASVRLRNAALAMNRTQAVDDALGKLQRVLGEIDKEPT